MTQDDQPPPDPVFNVAATPALKWTLVWMAVISLYTAGPHVFGAYSYGAYKILSTLAAITLAVLTIFGVATAWKFIGGAKKDPPWYTSGFLVALLIFWALAPPIWFFLEYYMFDIGAIKLPDKKLHDDFLKELKTYADLGSKVWAAAGASLGAAVAAARK